MKRQRETKEQRAMAQLIRRRMTQKDHGDKTLYRRDKSLNWLYYDLPGEKD